MPKTKHGLSRTPEYQAWKNAVDRCHNPSHRAYKNYGARGIMVCPEWRDDVRAFVDFIGNRPDANHELDRIDNAKGYEPGNVRWATISENLRNTRANTRYDYRGQQLLLVQLAEVSGHSPSCILWRLKAGFSVSDAVELKPSHGQVRDPEARRLRMCKIFVEHNGARLTVKEACALTGVQYGTAIKRISKYGWPVAQAVGLAT